MTGTLAILLPTMAVLALKLCLGSVEWLYAYFHSDNYAFTANGSCAFLDTNSTARSGEAPFVTSGLLLLFMIGMILTPMSGFLCDVYFGLVRLLRASVVAMILAAAGFLAIVYGRLACYPAAFYPAWLLMPLLSGLSEPLLLLAVFQLWPASGGPSGSLDLGRSLAVLAFYAAASLGETIGLAPYFDAAATEPGVGIESRPTALGVAAASTVTYAVLTLCVTTGTSSSRVSSRPVGIFKLPSGQRITAYWKVSVFVVLFLISIVIGRQDVTPMEMAYFRNASSGVAERRTCFRLLACFFTTGTVAACAAGSFALLLLRMSSTSRLASPSNRMRLGILLELGCRLCQVGANLILQGEPDEASSSRQAAVTGLYQAIAFVDGFSSGTTMPAVYEVVGALADAPAKGLILGVLITMWSLATFIGALILFPLKSLPPDAPVLQPPPPGQPPKFFILHLASVCFLLGSFACLQFVGLPNLRKLRATAGAINNDGRPDEEVEEEEDRQHEATPLLVESLVA